ncbi:hypothetical protein HYX13_00900 [Candidatus Woesearchaeota archaeon]|nr:hypothetical protein [Candidatus Woesearchaeota archaeon]
MKTYRNLYQKICSYENLFLAFRKARKGKTLLPYVIAFEQHLDDNLLELRTELLLHSYRPRPLKSFILRDPKTRTISVSEFRDRIVHHAICNIIEPFFEKTFIYDSYANRKRKGTLAAIERLESFAEKVSKNNTIVQKIQKKNCVRGFCLKADIKKYFDTVDHKKLMEILREKIKDKELLFLVSTILQNYSTMESKGMPLGNLTSQFFANVYLNELDQFVKHQLKAKYYLRYVDDFVILDNDAEKLQKYRLKIDAFLQNVLFLSLHENKSKIFPLSRGILFLGMRVFPHHRRLRKKSLGRVYLKLAMYGKEYLEKKRTYDSIYDFLEGWIAYAKQANTYKLRKRMLQKFEEKFSSEISTKEVNRHLPRKR